MPGSPATSPILAVPRFSNDDVTDFAGEINSIVDRLETALNALVPIGLPFAWPGATLPTFPLPAGVTAVPGTTPEFAWADGGLIDRTIYVAFFTVTGHVYNAGVDPGASMVRKPDKRGRVTMGADTMGGSAAGRLPNSNRALGQNGGEERHTLTAAEMPTHHHDLTVTRGVVSGTPNNSITEGTSSNTGTVAALSAFLGTTGGSGGVVVPHNVLGPYEVDNVIVRIA
jgi:microcystin-dependent protein